MDRGSRSRRRRRVLVVLPLVAAALAGAYLYLRESGLIESLELPTIFAPPDTETPQRRADAPMPPLPPAPPVPPPPPLAEEMGPPPEPLPALAESDSLASDLVRGLSSNPRLASWLAHGSVVRRFVAVVDNVADGESPRPHVPFLAPEGEFRTATIRGDRLVIDPRSYDRYDAFADAIASLDTQGSVELYRRLRPLTDEAYGELGRSDRSFDDALRSAIRRVLATPLVEGDVGLVPRVISFGYDDPRLQEMGPVEKHLVRLGPRNLRIVQERVRAFALELGIPPSELPDTPVLHPLVR
jgi:hypothetical protein